MLYNTSMKTAILSALIVATLSGCANVQPPVDVQIIPNDCANQTRIIRWLEDQARAVSSNSSPQYRQYHAQVKNRIWLLRYNCNPA
jgi:type IV pilus biogenesis protein CpaD/CtpE